MCSYKNGLAAFHWSQILNKNSGQLHWPCFTAYKYRQKNLTSQFYKPTSFSFGSW